MKNYYWLLLAAAVAYSLNLVKAGNAPEYFDRFGIWVFVFLTGAGAWMVKEKKQPIWMSFTIMSIGILGLIVDGSIVFGWFK